MGRRAIDVLKTLCDHLGYNQIVTLEDEDTLPSRDRKLVRALNRVLRVMSNVQDWRFLRTDGEIITTAEYKVGVVRMTSGSRAVGGFDDPNETGTAVPVWTTDMVGRALMVAGTPLPYRIVSVDSATSLTLNRDWQGDSTQGTDDEPDLNYQILQDRYELPTDMDRPADDRWTLYRETSTFPVFIRDADTLRDRRDARGFTTGTDDPEIVVIWDTDEELEHRVAIFDPPPRFQRVISFPYHRIHPTIDRDTQRILYPPRYEEVILSAVIEIMRDGPDDDTRTDMALAEFIRARLESASAREIGQPRIVLSPSQERRIQQYAMHRRRGVRIDYGPYFDRADFYDLDSK